MIPIDLFSVRKTNQRKVILFAKHEDPAAKNLVLNLCKEQQTGEFRISAAEYSLFLPDDSTALGVVVTSEEYNMEVFAFITNHNPRQFRRLLRGGGQKERGQNQLSPGDALVFVKTEPRQCGNTAHINLTAVMGGNIILHTLVVPPNFDSSVLSPSLVEGICDVGWRPFPYRGKRSSANKSKNKSGYARWCVS